VHKEAASQLLKAKIESAVASKPGPETAKPGAKHHGAKKKQRSGAVTAWTSSHRELISAAVTDPTAIAYPAITWEANHLRRSGVVIG
jgi:hypothetical protein